MLDARPLTDEAAFWRGSSGKAAAEATRPAATVIELSFIVMSVEQRGENREQDRGMTV